MISLSFRMINVPALPDSAHAGQLKKGGRVTAIRRHPLCWSYAARPAAG